MAFFNVRLEENKREFHADDLRRFIIAKTGIAAPASADRVMRHLRQVRVVDYRVVSRSKSLYEIEGVSMAYAPVLNEAR